MPKKTIAEEFGIDPKTLHSEEVMIDPSPVIASEKKPVAFTNSCELEYLDFKRADGGLVTGAMWKEWDKDADIALFTSPPNTADIEQRTAEAIAKMIQGWSCTNGPSIAEAIRSGKWREYL